MTSMERPEQLATAGATVSTTTTTSSKQLEGQTTRAVELTMSKDAVNVANTEVPEQVPKQVSKQEVPEQVAPKQSLSGTLSEGQVPKMKSERTRADHDHHELDARWSAQRRSQGKISEDIADHQASPRARARASQC
jgi:hypothetical protein